MLSIETAQGSSKFQVELARTSEEQRVGLMFRRELASNAGMLFDYRPAPSHQSIWMKNTLIPLDVLFVDCVRECHTALAGEHAFQKTRDSGSGIEWRHPKIHRCKGWR